MTGEEFAAALGISVSSVRNMERGVLAVSGITAEKVFILFGADPKTVVPRKAQALSAVRPEPYTLQTYQEWLRLTAISEEKVNLKIEKQLIRMRFLLKAAHMHGTFFAMDLQVTRWREQLARQSKLEGLIQTLIRSAGTDESWFDFDVGTVGIVEHVVATLERESQRISEPVEMTGETKVDPE
jgi:transcriptional regulator with XRE-family HTH domain